MPPPHNALKCLLGRTIPNNLIRRTFPNSLLRRTISDGLLQLNASSLPVHTCFPIRELLSLDLTTKQPKWRSAGFLVFLLLDYSWYNLYYIFCYHARVILLIVMTEFDICSIIYLRVIHRSSIVQYVQSRDNVQLNVEACSNEKH